MDKPQLTKEQLNQIATDHFNRETEQRRFIYWQAIHKIIASKISHHPNPNMAYICGIKS